MQRQLAFWGGETFYDWEHNINREVELFMRFYDLRELAQRRRIGRSDFGNPKLIEYMELRRRYELHPEILQKISGFLNEGYSRNSGDIIIREEAISRLQEENRQLDTKIRAVNIVRRQLAEED